MPNLSAIVADHTIEVCRPFASSGYEALALIVALVVDIVLAALALVLALAFESAFE